MRSDHTKSNTMGYSKKTVTTSTLNDQFRIRQMKMTSHILMFAILFNLMASSVYAFLPPLPSTRTTPFKIRRHFYISTLHAVDDGMPDMFDDVSFSRSDLEILTVNELKQQLRLRGKKVGGVKNELIDRLLKVNFIDPEIVNTMNANGSSDDSKQSKAREFAESRGKEFTDVSDYLDDSDKGKSTKSTKDKNQDEEEEEFENESKEDSSPESWGSEAKIVDDYDGRSVVVDGMSRTVVEFKGSKKKNVQAYVVASRDSLKQYLAGGNRGNNATDLETAMKNIQIAREKASKVPMKLEDVQGEDVDDEEGLYTKILDRDYGDWGKYSMTGVQLSAQEVKGVLLLSDVYGPFSDDMQMLADKIAFECQPAVVFAPDLFRGEPWKEDESNPGFSESGKSYEEWRACHPDDRVSVDIRAAAAALREQYGVSSISLFGTCYGGGRALEATARVYPNDTTDDVNEEEGPSHGKSFVFLSSNRPAWPIETTLLIFSTIVDPATCIAWYPTRYNAEALFGANSRPVDKENGVKSAIMAIFAGEDELPGATPADAAKLKECLENDSSVMDNMVKVFGGQKHGFAHIGMSQESNIEEPDHFLEGEFGGTGTRSMVDGDAEVASLLSTAWVDTYARQFLPTIGEAVKDNDLWSDINMPDLSESKTRDIRAEMEEALENHTEEDFDLKRMHPDDFKTPIDDLEDMDEKLYEALQTQPYGSSLEDDPDAFLDKLEAAIDRDDFDYLPGFGQVPLDDSVDGPAYW